MAHYPNIKPKNYQAYVSANFEKIRQIDELGHHQRETIRAVAEVLPFKVNNYVLDELIDWDNIPDDPMFQLTFPQEGMLSSRDLHSLLALRAKGAGRDQISKKVHDIRMGLNPHPAGQIELNVPTLYGKPQKGMQHKYRETLLFFPSQGQTCHAYCTYCFRWAQFVGMEGLRFANNEASSLARYVEHHSEISDVLFTGGDPMIMKTSLLRGYIEPLLKIDSLKSIRIGTKALAWWPYRFVTDPDADDLLRLFEQVIKAGKNMAIMAHYSHPRELSTPIGELAVRRVLSSGAQIRCQAPLIHRVNDSAHAWSDMWTKQVNLGATPYYMFVERDTGPKKYFDVPLFRALRIFTRAYRKVSGLGRTVRGPSMSATPGKVLVDGIAEINNQKVFVLKFLQSRDPEWTNRLFFAKYDEKASWLSDLKPAFSKKFFFEDDIRAIKSGRHRPLWDNQEPHPEFSKTQAGRGYLVRLDSDE